MWLGGENGGTVDKGGPASDWPHHSVNHSTRSYAVLGAGALGLTVGMRLAERGYAVTVYEREELPGGLAAGFRLGNAHLEKFYHHLFKSDRHAIKLMGELQLGDRLEWKTPRTVVLRDGKLWPMDSAGAVVRFAPIPMSDRLRMGGALAYLKLLPTADGLEGKKASAWIRRRMGNRAYRALWEPLLQSKFGERHDDVALPWFWARVHYRTAALGYPRGGFQQLYDSLSHRIVGLGSKVELSTEVKSIQPQSNSLVVVTANGSQRFDAVVSTLPTRLTAMLTPSLPAAYSHQYGSVEALGAMCLVLGLDRPLTDAYWINISDPGFPFQPIVEHTNFADPTDYGGRHIVYLGNYLPMDHRYFRLSKEEMFEEFAPSLVKLNPDFSRSWITDLWLFRAPYAQPIVTPGYRAGIPPHVTPIPGLYLANMFQVYPQDRGQNYSIALAERLVSRFP